MNEGAYKFDDSLGYLAANYSRLMLFRNMESFAVANLPISAEQWIVLVHIWAEEGIPQKKIADHMKMDKTSFSRLITTLEKSGMLFRCLNPNDAREKYMYLTEMGKTIMDQATKLVQGELEKSYSGIPQEHLDICRAVLKKAFNNMK